MSTEAAPDYTLPGVPAQDDGYQPGPQPYQGADADQGAGEYQVQPGADPYQGAGVGPEAYPIGPEGPPSSDSKKRPLEEAEGPAETKRSALSQPQPETIFRLIVPAAKAGILTANNGAAIGQVGQQTGARIRMIDPMPGTEEHIAIISSSNDLLAGAEDTNAAQRALQALHASISDSPPPEAQPGAAPPSAMVRLLVCHTQAGSVIGKAGKIIKDIRDASGAHVKILPPEQLPRCALLNDRVVQLMGTVEQLNGALELIGRQLRDNPAKERPTAPAIPAAVMYHHPPPQQQQQQANIMMSAPPQYYGAPPLGMGHPPHGPPRYM